MNKRIILTLLIGILFSFSYAQKLIPFKLTETGQTTSYTSTQGEDADFLINPMSFTNNGDGTVTDNNTRLVWQKLDGGEMTYEKAVAYCDSLTLAGYADWRLPTGIELFSINNHGKLNPAIDTAYFTQTLADYWWTSEKRCDDTTKIWVVNSGGGIGAHPKTETISAGGTKRFHVRAVRDAITTTFSVPHFTENDNGTITDNNTGLVWQKIQNPDTITWEQALTYASSLTLAGKSDWRLPNIKELQSLNIVSIHNPSFDKNYFTNVGSGNYWSSTSMHNTPTLAWDINVDYGIVSYNNKALKENVLLVRGGMDTKDMNFTEALIPAGIYDMGDHFGFVDPGHPSDETPIHTVKVDSFYMSKTETTNQMFLTYLNASLLNGELTVTNNTVYRTGDTNIICYTNQFASFYSISYTGNSFTMADYRAYHPMVGVMWSGCATFCNWLSLHNGLQPCYNLTTWNCDSTKNGYRLPTEAEWEWAGRGGHINPYYNYACGDSIDQNRANLPTSGDPYESGTYPQTTPVGFYDGTIKQKADFNWPATNATYQTLDGANGFGLYDMQGNAWEMLNDWYGQNYYSVSPYNNPKGPATGFIMPDGKPYRGMRGGNWYNGLMINGKSDGHSRISNRNPTYYRGPQDPNHPWYHVGFRVMRSFDASTVGINESGQLEKGTELNSFPNPFNNTTTIKFRLDNADNVTLKVYNAFGQVITTVVNEKLEKGMHSYQWNGDAFASGIYYIKLQTANKEFTNKMILIK